MEHCEELQAHTHIAVRELVARNDETFEARPGPRIRLRFPAQGLTGRHEAFPAFRVDAWRVRPARTECIQDVDEERSREECLHSAPPSREAERYMQPPGSGTGRQYSLIVF